MLGACMGVPVKESDSGGKAAYDIRAQKLAAVSHWGFVGKISLDDGDQGGSGRLRWAVRQDHSELDFHGAMGRGAWNLTIDPGKAVLREANGTEQTSADVNQIVQDRVGWRLPVDALQWWVRGLAAPGAIEGTPHEDRSEIHHAIDNVSHVNLFLDRTTFARGDVTANVAGGDLL